MHKGREHELDPTSEAGIPIEADASINVTRRKVSIDESVDDVVDELFPHEPDLYVQFVRAKHKKLIEFARDNNHFIDIYTVDDKRIIVFDDGTRERIPDAKLRSYKEEQTLHYGEMFHSCYAVAENAIANGTVIGMLRSDNIDHQFVWNLDHGVNYDELPDGSVLAIDFTAVAKIDKNAGNFNTLAIRAANKTQLITKLGKLYGGDWRDMK